jgi:Mg-chelatase subunit ChlD
MARQIVTLILDETGSMQSVRGEAVGGVNEYMQTLRGDKESRYRVTLITFNSCTKPVTRYEARKAEDVEDLKPGDYSPDCTTPLYDTIAHAILLTAAGKSKKPPILVIMTDGLENASTDYDLSAIKAMIGEKEAQGWVFVFLAADLDAERIGTEIGITTKTKVAFRKDLIAPAFDRAAVVTKNYTSGKLSADDDFFGDTGDG